jgi:murein DD-endopeptidase MepM/ murein hydrolase activator NlpD
LDGVQEEAIFLIKIWLFLQYWIEMNKTALLLLLVILSSILTASLYESVSVLIYRVSEPRFSCPIRGKVTIRNDSRGEGDFGTKRSNGRTHSGIDIEAPIGTPVYASKSGLVFCGNVPTGYGKYVMIYHPDGLQSFYGHLSNWAIVSPRKIRRGEIIGFVGKTGNAAYKDMVPHLHFEIRKDGEALDPRSLMK